jgi:hypothetical protein
MIRDEHIEAAVAQGIITSDQAQRLRDLAREGSVPAAAEERAPDPDDERFRLIGGFNDVFVTIGVGLLVAALFALASVLEFRIGFSALAMVAAWGLSEYFSRRMRLALPSIALAAMFAGGAAFAAASLGAQISTDATLISAGLGAALAAVAHERRFQVPIDWAIAAMGVVWAIVGAASLAVPEHNTPMLYATLGLAIFLVALRVDSSDLARRTRRSDIAFWLHLVAAPMIVHGLIPQIAGRSADLSTAQALAILLVFAVLGLVAIVIDRRALLVSGLAYAGIAIAYLVSQSLAEGVGVSMTLLTLAVLVLGLSAGWRTLRRRVLAVLPLGPLISYVPPAT